MSVTKLDISNISTMETHFFLVLRVGKMQQQQLISHKCCSSSLPFHPQLILKNPFHLSSNNNRRNLTVKSRRSEYFEPQHKFNTTNSFSPQQSLGALPRVFVGHSIYKGKAALTIEPKAPDFSPLDSGAYKLSKEGFVLLQFAPASGVRQYDWSRKQVFSLSVTEIGTLMGLGAKDSCEFFHDPNKGKRRFGFYLAGVQNKLLNVDESIYIPVSKAEFTVLVSAFNYILPFLLGWHAFANSINPEDSSRFNNSRSGADLEWSR
ncbi:hypothetical protein IFM89_023433 [Coptis chinensis]|uniref:Single-stranded DNA-binding protein WHY1, chloroplastic n=1 Tax=Coptis chinensis TaxID=261450 RepID=A0A835IZH6_9MAGN|nr:hypothetical protein IFM89_023433 [Coptis chinensis]